MDGLKLIEPSDLYNFLNRQTSYPCISDPNYLLILDARPFVSYNESHIFTAKKAPRTEKGDFLVPYDAELECKANVVVYDGKTQSLRENTPATRCAQSMWKMASRHRVKVLRGGYELFSAIYPFLRTQEMIYMARELDNYQTYPIELVSGCLYIGNWKHGNTAYIQKDVKIKGHINCSVERETFFKDSRYVLHLAVEDTNDADLFSHFQDCVNFIDARYQKGYAVLVFSKHGISRSACVAMAYLMARKSWRLKEAYKFALECNPAIRPNRGFIKQLRDWEIQLYGDDGKSTDISDPNY